MEVLKNGTSGHPKQIPSFFKTLESPSVAKYATICAYSDRIPCEQGSSVVNLLQRVGPKGTQQSYMRLGATVHHSLTAPFVTVLSVLLK
jgi:hypothetical protein